MIYLDYNSTTPVNGEVLKEMLPFFSESFGNPSSAHSLGQKALHALDLARMRVAKFLGCNADEIIFTGSGTESDNLAISGIMQASPSSKNHIITSMIEHSAVYNQCKKLEESGFSVTYLPVGKDGKISVKELESSITEKTALISIMLANNETGVVQNIKEIAKLAEAHEIFFHTDAVQAAGKIKFTVESLGVDLISISAHKFYGPKGVGALYVRRGIKLLPIILGGGQEKKLRASTENVPGIVGLGKASELADKDIDKNITFLAEKRDTLEREILANIPFAKINSGNAERTPNTTNISFPGMESETLLVKLDLNGIAVSSGAACGASSKEASRTLKALGLPSKELYSSLRFSVGLNTTDEEIRQTIKILKKICNPA